MVNKTIKRRRKRQKQSKKQSRSKIKIIKGGGKKVRNVKYYEYEYDIIKKDYTIIEKNLHCISAISNIDNLDIDTLKKECNQFNSIDKNLLSIQNEKDNIIILYYKVNPTSQKN